MSEGQGGAERAQICDSRLCSCLILIPIYKRHFEPGQLQFITTSTYPRSQLILSSQLSAPSIQLPPAV